jgi:anti-anti-sigma regulatory factor
MRRAALRRAQRGAVLLEFLVVFMPLVLLFVGVWQASEVYAAQLVLARASSAAGRAASVVFPDNPQFYGGAPQDSFDGERKADVTLAAGLSLAASPHFTKDFSATLNAVPQREFGVVDVTVVAHLDCHGLRILCPFAQPLEMSTRSALWSVAPRPIRARTRARKGSPGNQRVARSPRAKRAGDRAASAKVLLELLDGGILNALSMRNADDLPCFEHDERHTRRLRRVIARRSD